MQDLALIDLIMTQIEVASASGGYNYPVISKQQPTQQGIPSTPAIFYERLFDRHYGYPMTEDVYNPVTKVFDEITEQIVETTIQFSALVIQKPSDTTVPTPSDVVEFICMYVQTPSFVSTLGMQKVNVLRVSDVRNSYFEDDRHLNESNPNFDLVVVHSRNISVPIPATNILVAQNIIPI